MKLYTNIKCKHFPDIRNQNLISELEATNNNNNSFFLIFSMLIISSQDLEPIEP